MSTKKPKRSVFASYLIRFKPLIDTQFFACFLKSPFYWKEISEKSSGIALANVNATKLNQNELVYVYPVSRSWEEGSGYFEQSPIKSDDGATWTAYASASNWSGSLEIPGHGVGGDFNLTPVVSASVATIVNDELRINVTDIVQSMYSGSGDPETFTSNYGM